MGKGLPRSMSRGHPQRQEIMKVSYRVDGKVINVAATSTAPGAGTGVIGDLPEGDILLLGAVGRLSFTGPGSANLSDTWNGDFAIGTAANADTDLADPGDADILPSTALGPATGEAVGTTRAQSTQTEHALILDNTDGSLELNLNILVDAADIVDDTNVDLTVNGVVTLLFSVLGDD